MAFPTGNALLDAAILLAEGTRQAALAAATTQAAADAANLAYYTTVQAAYVTYNAGLGAQPIIAALAELAAAGPAGTPT